MLRKRLLTTIGALIIAMLLTGVAAVMLLEHTASELSEVGAKWETVNRRQIEITKLMDRITEDSVLDGAPTDALPAALGQLDEIVESEEADRLADAEIARILIGKLKAEIASSSKPTEPLSSLVISLDEALARMSQSELFQLRNGQLAATRELRLILLGLTLAFIVLINLAVVVILRASRLVVEPVESLVQASRRVARGQYDTRVEISVKNEFGELGRAFNDMISGLEDREAKRVETMKQAAAAVSHELNNAIAGLDLQLDLIERAAAKNMPFDESIQRIREAVLRIARTTDSLRRVRRIVLTDYAGGETMLDLARSCEEPVSGQSTGSDQPAPIAQS